MASIRPTISHGASKRDTVTRRLACVAKRQALLEVWPQHFAARQAHSLSNHVVVWPVWESGDVLVAVFRDDQNIMLTIPPCPGLTFRDGQHRFH